MQAFAYTLTDFELPRGEPHGAHRLLLSGCSCCTDACGTPAASSDEQNPQLNKPCLLIAALKFEATAAASCSQGRCHI